MIENFLKNINSAHSKIDNLIDGSELKSKLKEMSGINDIYGFGEENKGIFMNNLIDSIVDSQTDKNRSFEDLFQLGIGGTFGKENNWNALLTGGKNWGEFNIGRKF